MLFLQTQYCFERWKNFYGLKEFINNVLAVSLCSYGNVPLTPLFGLANRCCKCTPYCSLYSAASLALIYLHVPFVCLLFICFCIPGRKLLCPKACYNNSNQIKMYSDTTIKTAFHAHHSTGWHGARRWGTWKASDSIFSFQSNLS